MLEEVTDLYSVIANLSGKVGRVNFVNYNNTLSRQSSYTPFRNVSLAIVVCNNEDKESIKNVKNWYGEVKRYCGNMSIIKPIIVGMFKDNTMRSKLSDEYSVC